MPDGVDATDPDPVRDTDNVQILTNVAVTDFAADIVTEHEELVPEQSPDHESKRQPVAGVADNETTVLTSMLAESDDTLGVTAIPDADDTEPEPVRDTDNV